MGDAVLRVRGQLQSMGRENWSALEERHARNVAWLRDELAQISRSLEIKARFEHMGSVAPAPFPGDQEDVAGPAKKKQKIEEPREDAAPAPAAATHRGERGKTRLSMRLRARAQIVDIVTDTGAKRTRKRGRPSEGLLRDPGKLKVVELRSELKSRGLRTSGLKAVLFDRLLDALEQEQKEGSAQVKEVAEEEPAAKQKEVAEEEPAAKQKEVVVIDDDEGQDEIVRESVGSNKSPRSFLTSQTTSPQATVEDGKEDVAAPTAMVEDVQHRLSPQTRRSKGEASETPSTAEAAPEADPAGLEQQQQQHSSEANVVPSSHSSGHDVEFTIAGGAEELIAHDVLKVTRKSMQVSEKSELTSPLTWKRRSILRKASSLAPSTQRPAQNVSFAPTDKVDMIVENSQTDSTQPDPSPEKNPSSIEAHTSPEDSKFARSDSIPEASAKTKTVSTPAAPSSASISPQDPPTQAIPEIETEKQRKKREFDENVQREAQKLRLAALLSAQKRLEEAKASKAFWAKRDQLKAKLRASSAGEKRKSAHTPASLSERPASDHVSPPTSEASTATESTSSASDTNRQTTSATKDETRAQHTTRLDAEEARDHDFIRSMARRQEVESISDVSSGFESSLHEPTAPRATYSVVDDTHQTERSMSHRLVAKPAAKSMPATEGIPKESSENDSARLDTKTQQLHRPTVVSSTTSHKSAAGNAKPEPPKTQTAEPLSNRDRSDSLSSTVSSIPEPSVVENALKSGASTAANSNRRPISNLVSGLHSFTTLLEKSTAQESNSGRSAPVVNALKLAEKSRVREERKRLEKERNKAILKKKMEEHKKTAALREKAEKDAQAKREQDQLNERKKREVELARKRQQRLKEMRAGLEKKRAMLAAEKKSRHASSAALASKSATSATAASQLKHRGLASASEASQPTAKAISKPLQKPVSKLMSKPVSKLAPASKPAPNPVAKSVSRPAMTSPTPAKHAPKSHSPEIMNYEMSDNAESSDGDSSDSDADRHGKKKVPRWAQKDHLSKVLHAQFGKNAIDPSPAIFQEFVDTCNLEAIFETTDVRKKKKFARRTSSGNWLADRPTARDKALYQRDMGYKR